MLFTHRCGGAEVHSRHRASRSEPYSNGFQDVIRLNRQCISELRKTVFCAETINHRHSYEDSAKIHGGPEQTSISPASRADLRHSVSDFSRDAQKLLSSVHVK